MIETHLSVLGFTLSLEHGFCHTLGSSEVLSNGDRLTVGPPELNPDIPRSGILQSTKSWLPYPNQYIHAVLTGSSCSNCRTGKRCWAGDLTVPYSLTSSPCPLHVVTREPCSLRRTAKASDPQARCLSQRRWAESQWNESLLAAQSMQGDQSSEPRE